MADARIHESWSSGMVFILASVGSAVGLGNIWRFSYLAGENGGGAFVLLYVACVAVVALPVLVAEIMMGRRGGMSPVNTMRKLALEAGARPWWRTQGWIAITVVFVVLTFYSLIAGWCLAYIGFAAAGALGGLDREGSNALFETLLADPVALAALHGLFTAACVYIVARGLRRGIERAVTWLMPVLFGILGIMVVYAFVAGAPAPALAFLFSPDISQIDAGVVLAAISQAFFSIAVGAGAMMTYGAYLSRQTSIPGSAAIVAFADTAVAILAGLAIFPLVFAHGLEPAEGPGLIFVTLPIAFGQMPGGAVLGVMFFFLLAVAALTSIIATLEAVVAWGEEHRGISRRFTAITVGLCSWVLGLASVFSFNIWSDVRPLGFSEHFADMRIFDLLEYFSLSVLLPISGLMLALFAGWAMHRAHAFEELQAPAWVFAGWRFLVRYVAPTAILAVFVASVI